jgi:hypothetical protein
LALFDNRFKETAKDFKALAGTYLRQAGVIGQGLVQIIPKIPSHAQPIRRMPHQLPF